MNDRNSHTEGVTLSYKELISLKKCEEKFQYERLYLHREGDEQKECISSLFNFVMTETKTTASVKKTYAAFLNRLDSVFKREWFEFDAQYTMTRHYYAIAFKRMLSYLGKDICVIDTNVSAKAHVMISYKKLCICDIIVTASAILKRNGRTVVVLFEDDVNPFSDMAKKVSNHPSRSIALICAYLAFAPIYGTNIDVETWYLGSKDDKNGCLNGVFEAKPGKNIASFSFGNCETAFLRLRESLSAVEEKNCNGCLQKDVCCFRREYYKERQCTVHYEKKCLSDEQSQIVSFKNGAMCCFAPPGTGKTTALVYRVKHLIEQQVEPSSILWIASSEENAEETKRNIMSFLYTEDVSKIPVVVPIERLAYSVLHEYPLLIGRRVRVADSLDRLVLIKQAVVVSPPIKKTSYFKSYLDFGLIRLLDQLFEEIEREGREAFCVKYENRLDVKGIIRVYDEYLEQLKNFTPYEMLVNNALQLFRKHPSIVNDIASKYRYIIVDNFQDVSKEQATMLYAVAKEHGNIVIAGDPEQSICMWRDCAERSEFFTAFPDAYEVNMSFSFRTNHSFFPVAKKIESIEQLDIGLKPVYLQYTSKKNLAEVVLTVLRSGYEPRDIAVLARTNSQLSEAKYILDDIVKTSCKKYLRTDTTFMLLHDIISLFYHGMNEDVAFYRFLSFYGKVEAKKDPRKSLYENIVLRHKDKNSIPEAYQKAITNLQKAFDCLKTCKGIEDALKKLCSIFFVTSSHPVVEQLIDKANKKAIVDVREFYNYMCDIIRYSDNATVWYQSAENSVKLLTVHGSKGKEYPVVIVYGIEAFEFAKESSKLYVALTRAQKQVYLLESKDCENRAAAMICT